MVRKICLLTLVASLVLFAGKAMAQGAEPQIRVLPNGLTVMVQEDGRFPLASVRLYVHTGSAFEDPAQAGISHLLEHMVFRSTEKYPSGMVAKTIEGAGGELNASTSFDYTVYYVNVPADSAALGMDVIHDMIFGAKFLPEELEQEKKVVISELERGKDDSGDVLFESLQGLTWPETAYGRPIIGFKDTVSGVTPDDLRSYVKTHYQPQSMLLVVAGDVKADAVMDEAARLFGDIANDRVITPPSAFPDLAKGPGVSLAVDYGQWNKTYLYAAFEIPGMGDAREGDLEVLAQLLGGDETSRLYRKFKYDERLVDDVSLGAMTLERSGMLILSAELDPGNLDAFWKGLLEEFSTLKADSFSQEEIDRAKLNIEDSLYRAKETISGLASKLGYFAFFGYGQKGEEKFLASVRGADKTTLQAAIDAYIRPGALRAAFLLPKGEEGKITREGLASIEQTAWPASRTADSAGTAAKTAAGKADTIDLGKGRTLVLLPDKTLPYVSVSMVYNGGDALLARNEQGLAALASDVMVAGTRTRSANQIEDFLANRAASLGASSGRDSFTVSARFPSRFAKDVLGLMTEVLLEPAFDKAEFDRARESQLAAIKSKEDQPMGLAFRKLFPFIYASGPYAYMRLGEPAAIASFTPAETRAFWEKQRKAPWVMAVSGDFDRDMVERAARELAKAMEPATPFVFAKADWAAKREETLKLAERNQEHLLMVFPVEGAVSGDTPGLELLNSILAGQSGLLFKDLRDKQGLGYSVTSFLWQSVNTGFLAFYIGTDPAKAGQAMEGFRAAAANLKKEDLAAEELDRGKKLLVGDYYRERQSLSARSAEAAQDLAEGFPLDHRLSVIEKAKTLAAGDLRKLAEKYLDPANAYVMRIEP